MTDYLATRREAVLEAWEAAVAADEELTSSDDLSDSEFRDHIPEVLAKFEGSLRQGTPSEASPLEAADTDASAEHGEHRWKQGYDLREVLLEWGHLHCCLLNELERARTALPGVAHETFFSAQRSLAALVHTAVADSAEQFARLQQKEAIQARNDLESAVNRFIEAGERRAVIWRESAHDLRGQLSIITSATSLLEDNALEEALRVESVEMVQKGTRALKEMLGAVLENTQTDAIREEHRLGSFNAGALLGGLCASSQPLARERSLSLRSSGPELLEVEGDRGKVQRVAQNLLLNALYYTTEGGVTVSWQEEDADRWSFRVQDTGPGLPAKNNRLAGRGTGQPPGEGIGLAIVRRLCDLLGAHLHVKSAPGAGTAFTVTLPRRYAA